MRTGAAEGHEGYFHEAAFYASDQELLDVVVPFLEEGVAAGEPVLVAFGPVNERLLGTAFDLAKVTVIPGDEQYLRPAVAIRRYRELFARCVADGAAQVRVVGDVPHPGAGQPWDWWARYESVVNRVFDDFPLWGLCPYDTRITPEHVLDDVVRTHPRLATVDGRHVHNDGYEVPARFLSPWREAPRPLPEAEPPVTDLRDPTAAEARRELRAALGPSGIGRDRTEDFVMAVSEAVTNAFVHGRPPLRVRIWSGPGRAVVTVTDGGAGPVDPFTGLVAAKETRSAGVGLWMAHQICRHVCMYADEEGFVVRLEC
ncbi:anti-sigma regulatory factor (Ser/Thr protein kinase) [Amycolatopsis bartoniae]|uniref:Anti-sigma regulatory factor n=1 Tax=Amycolatopsis bartoniae TaxID=941986 RepID=A0A8H9IZY5_9PSEU|nr:sensor histidine kinase [Amycolatopsis bartoniae]MBB2936055.1 anti-sigma regulatory factor (Ser/Thr protein kinase) [Amycolatopsis bartoniae]TVT03544.1 sensor histidine kinase [Amycolatopsis bartoniae]GHF63806.1 anti-sigma regulatory factor [Amycolatopsis bartoniae]